MLQPQKAQIHIFEKILFPNRVIVQNLSLFDSFTHSETRISILPSYASLFIGIRIHFSHAQNFSLWSSLNASHWDKIEVHRSIMVDLNLLSSYFVRWKPGERGRRLWYDKRALLSSMDWLSSSILWRSIWINWPRSSILHWILNDCLHQFGHILLPLHTNLEHHWSLLQKEDWLLFQLIFDKN